MPGDEARGGGGEETGRSKPMMLVVGFLALVCERSFQIFPNFSNVALLKALIMRL